MNLEKMFKTPKEKFLPDDVKAANCEAEDLFLELATQLDALPESREKSLCMKNCRKRSFGRSNASPKLHAKTKYSAVGAQRQPLFLCRFSSGWQSAGFVIRGPWVKPHRRHHTGSTSGK